MESNLEKRAETLEKLRELILKNGYGIEDILDLATSIKKCGPAGRYLGARKYG